MYQSLLDMERKLDWNMTRKKVEVQDALSRVPTVRFAFHGLQFALVLLTTNPYFTPMK